uniref:FXYD domain-containing ion transport regulator n=1 Tax=Oncorhynchus tshawytscha TaxID=74940 RepID=A0A8C8F8M1_ONCTS
CTEATSQDISQELFVSDFLSDYPLLRRGGLIFAAVFFCLGIAIIFSKKLSCWKGHAK